VTTRVIRPGSFLLRISVFLLSSLSFLFFGPVRSLVFVLLSGDGCDVGSIFAYLRFLYLRFSLFFPSPLRTLFSRFSFDCRAFAIRLWRLPYPVMMFPPP